MPDTTPPYTFEHDGTQIEFYRATVRSRMESRRIVQKLLRAYGYIDTSAPDDEYWNMDEFAEVMARAKTAAPWWVNSSMLEEQIREKFELFLEAPPELYELFRTANRATNPPKKTLTTT